MIQIGIPTLGDQDALRTTLATAERLITQWSHDAAIVRLAREIVAGAEDTREEMDRIWAFVAANVEYRMDPYGMEWVQSPIQTLFVLHTGDCDDMAVATGSLLASLGHRVSAVAIWWTDADHASHAVLWDITGHGIVDPSGEPPASWPGRGKRVAAIQGPGNRQPWLAPKNAEDGTLGFSWGGFHPFRISDWESLTKKIESNVSSVVEKIPVIGPTLAHLNTQVSQQVHQFGAAQATNWKNMPTWGKVALEAAALGGIGYLAAPALFGAAGAGEAAGTGLVVATPEEIAAAEAVTEFTTATYLAPEAIPLLGPGVAIPAFEPGIVAAASSADVIGTIAATQPGFWSSVGSVASDVGAAILKTALPIVTTQLLKGQQQQAPVSKGGGSNVVVVPSAGGSDMGGAGGFMVGADQGAGGAGTASVVGQVEGFLIKWWPLLLVGAGLTYVAIQSKRR